MMSNFKININLETIICKISKKYIFFPNSSSSNENISVSSVIPHLSTPDNSGGTWKMIKGKVSQAMEDIKSSKSPTVMSARSNAFLKFHRYVKYFSKYSQAMLLKLLTMTPM